MLQMQNSEVPETCNESAFGLFMRAAVLLWASPYREASLQITVLCATVKPLCSGGSGRVREHISPIQTFQKMVWVWKYENEVNHMLWPSPSSLSWKVVTLSQTVHGPKYHQNTKWRNIFCRKLHLCSRAPDTWKINAMVHWSWSDGVLQKPFMLVYQKYCAANKVRSRMREGEKSLWNTSTQCQCNM